MKNKIKKLVTMLMAITMFAALISGCGKSKTGNDTANEAAGDVTDEAANDTDEAAGDVTDETANEAADDKESIKIGITCVNINEYMTSIFDGIKAAAEAYTGAAVEVVGPYATDYDPQKTFDHIESFKSMGCAATIVFPLDSTVGPEAVAAAEGMPLVFAFNQPEDDVLAEDTVTFVGSSDYEAGAMQGEYLVEKYSAEGKTEVNAVILMMTLNNQNSVDRTQGFIDTVEASDIKLNIVYQDACDSDATKALEKTSQLLGAGTEFDCVVANWDDGALGAIEALKMEGKLDGVTALGIDGSRAGIISIRDGELAMSSFLGTDVLGSKLFECAMMGANGEVLDPTYMIPYEIACEDTLDKYLYVIE